MPWTLARAGVARAMMRLMLSFVISTTIPTLQGLHVHVHSQQCTIMPGIDLRPDGTGMGSHPNVTSADSCCALCLARADCSSWTLYDSTCYFKPVATGTDTCETCISGLSGRPPPAPAGTCSVMPGVDARPDGADLIRYDEVDTTARCCAYCAAFPGCVAWTLFGNSCFLKPGFEGTTNCSSCTSGYLGSSPPPSGPPAPSPQPKLWAHRGMTFTGGRYCPEVAMGSDAAKRSMIRLASTGANWIALIVTQYQWTIDSTTIIPLYNASEVYDSTNDGYYTFVTLTDAQLRGGIRHARELGLKILLKPHIDLLRDNKPNGRYWRGNIGTNFNESEWDAWFRSYEAFIIPYARMAQEENVSMLSVNTELLVPNKWASNSARWRALVHKLRNVFTGSLTVAAIKEHEQEVLWWDAVDVIGVDAYYNIQGNNVAEMARSWQQYREVWRALSKQYGGKNVTLTEIGYCSGQCSRTHTPSASDLQKHAMHYEAVFEAFRNDSSWFLGAFWWNWNTDPGYFNGDDCLTPQLKPAEEVLRKYYQASAPKPPPPTEAAQCIGNGKCTC